MSEQGLGSGPLNGITVVGGGTQNILIRFWRDGREYVLRRPPRYKRANSDETMIREARILAALALTDVPHAGLIATCDDLDVVGAAFYLMEPVDGVNPTVAVPDGLAANLTRQYDLGIAIVSGLARLGGVDPVTVGLADLGKPDEWLERQVPRWRRQLASYAALEGYCGNELARVDEIGRWLECRRPRPRSWRPGLIHGDFHLANVMVRQDQPTLAAIVDWELASQGDPLLDLGQLLATWPRNDYPLGVDPAVPLPGLPTDRELLDWYGRHCDRDLEHVTWFRVLACYRLAILIEGTFARALAGMAPMEIGELSHRRAVALLDQATDLVEGR
ncbi:phosphotransferase family protein [Tamaricihabitans halophyticus]|nr:phosphotransferase family protein [Tamaricihabitans halophyticus]